MKQIYNTRELAIPDDVTCDIKSKVVTVKGPRGESSQRIGALPQREREREVGESGGPGESRRPAPAEESSSHVFPRVLRITTPKHSETVFVTPVRASERLTLSLRPFLGSLKRDLSHLQVDLYKIEVDGKPTIKVEVWHGTSKRLAGTRTVISHINNMFLGVTRGFRYSMRLVYAHFPINVTIEDAGKTIEIRNFLGEKRVRIVKMLEGVTVAKDKAVKDQLILEGNDIENVSRSAAQIHQSCLVRAKDIRKFLDGVYVNGKGHVFNPEE